MEIGHVERTVISKASRRRGGRTTQEVVVKTAAYRIRGVMKFISQTKHEVI